VKKLVLVLWLVICAVGLARASEASRAERLYREELLRALDALSSGSTVESYRLAGPRSGHFERASVESVVVRGPDLEWRSLNLLEESMRAVAVDPTNYKYVCISWPWFKLVVNVRPEPIEVFVNGGCWAWSFRRPGVKAYGEVSPAVAESLAVLFEMLFPEKEQRGNR
jgi:hypothetical protein